MTSKMTHRPLDLDKFSLWQASWDVLTQAGKIILILFAGICSCNPVVAQEITNKQEQLQQLTQSITQLQDTLKTEQNQQNILFRHLKTTKLTINKQENNLYNLQQQLLIQQEKLTILHQSIQEKQKQLQYHQKSLTQQLRIAYLLEKKSYGEIIFNQTDPNIIKRLLIYHRYLAALRLHFIQNYQGLLNQLIQNKIQLLQTQAQLQTLQAALDQENQHLHIQLLTQQKLYQHLHQEIDNSDAYLQTLLQNKEGLEKIVGHLSINVENKYTSEPISLSHPFLPWPTLGVITQQYGQPWNGTRVRTTGIFIQAREGQAVKAIQGGKVIFADWLKGYGLLIIINHSQGYMSLYGNNQSLYKKVGAIVQRSETIASVGHSGGNEKSSLYFEIRYNGKPLNPLTLLANP